MSFLSLEGKHFAVAGLANKRSVAHFIAKTLVSEGAKVTHIVRSEEIKESTAKLRGDSEALVCDVENTQNLEALKAAFAENELDGFVSSSA